MEIGEEVWRLDGRAVAVSNLDKLYWPEDGLTKRDMLAYYRRMAPAMLPHFRDRPVTLRMFPAGIHGRAFYRREVPPEAPAWLRTARYEAISSRRTLRVPVVDSTAALIWLANQGALEFHLWAARLPALDETDLAIFDLDPGPGTDFAAVLEASLRLREKLGELDLQGHPKTSGGSGLHVYVPLRPGHPFDGVREWVRGIAAGLVDAHPRLFRTARGATHRGHGVSIDHAQNSRGRNTAAVYTLRALPGAPASAPVSWKEIEAGTLRPGMFTLRSLPARVERLGDLFAPVLSEQQTLPC